MGVFSLLQQIYPHNKKEQQSAECIKGSLGVKGESVPEAPENIVDMIKCKLGGKKKNNKTTERPVKIPCSQKLKGSLVQINFGKVFLFLSMKYLEFFLNDLLTVNIFLISSLLVH